VTLSEAVVRRLKQEAARSGRPFRAVMEEALARGLEAAPKRGRYRLRTRRLGGALPGVDLTKALELAAAIEDQETARRLELRK
jgi:hypothetical protein